MIKCDADALLMPCPRCGSPEQLRIAQSVFHSLLVWNESLDCERCGLRTEADGTGLPPMEIRDRMLSIDGEWSVVMKEARSTRSVAEILRKHLSLGPQNIVDLLRNQSEMEIYRGTRVEAYWLIDLLKAIGEEPMAVGPS